MEKKQKDYREFLYIGLLIILGIILLVIPCMIMDRKLDNIEENIRVYYEIGAEVGELKD